MTLKGKNDISLIYNGTNTAFTPAELGEMGCSENCQLQSDGEATLAAGAGEPTAEAELPALGNRTASTAAVATRPTEAAHGESRSSHC